MNPGYKCVTCGQWHDDLPMCFGPAAPYLYETMPPEERVQRAEINADQCVIDDEHFFVRGRLEISVLDNDGPFVWLVWVSLSLDNFMRACELWETPGREKELPYFSWLSSKLPYRPDTLSLKTKVHTRPVGQRPFIELEPIDHPLAIEQRNGITMSRIQEIVSAVLHGNPVN